MRTITSAHGNVEAVTVRRTESADAQEIDGLIGPSAVALFGKVNVIHLLEKANLAVTLAKENSELVAHACFLDYPAGDMVDQAAWEHFLHRHFQAQMCTPLNTLFLHLYVSQPSFARDSIKEILRAVFNAITELEYVCLVRPNVHVLEPSLDEVFQPLKALSEAVAGCLLSVCHRQQFCPRLHIRQARVEDHDDLMTLFAEQSEELSNGFRRNTLVQLIEAQNELNQAAVCESDGVAVGFTSVGADVDLELLNECFELSVFDGLYKPQTEPVHTEPVQSEPVHTEPVHTEPVQSEPVHTEPVQSEPVQSEPVQSEPVQSEPVHTEPVQSEPVQSEPVQSEPVQSEPVHTEPVQSEPVHTEPVHTEPVQSEPVQSEPVQSEPVQSDHPELPSTQSFHLQDATEKRSTADRENPSQEPNAFSIQMFVIDRHHESRSVDFLPYIFKLFPDRDLCIITVPKLAPELPLLQGFLRARPRPYSHLPLELYVFHRSGLKSVEVRAAVRADRATVCGLVDGFRDHQELLEDLDMFLQARRDPDGTLLQAFVAQVENQVVGIVIIRDEQDVEYIQARYDIERFIYFSQHRYEDHGRLCHFALGPAFQHYAQHFLKEALRLAHKSCLYRRLYHPLHRRHQSSRVPSAASVLNCTVPVRPRRQIVYPLEEMGDNAPSWQITKEQEPFAINLFSRKLTMEPKVTVNTRIVVVGASDTGLSFLQVLAFCPHLRFNNLTLISTHGFPGDRADEDVRFLSTSHCYSWRDLALLSLRSCVTVVTGKMVALDRGRKHILVSGGGRLPYDHLILCTGQQYQVPRPTGEDLSQPVDHAEVQPLQRRFGGLVPSNLLVLNDQHDCAAAHAWLCREFVREEDAVVYGRSLDVYTCVEALLGLGVPGHRVHLVLTPCRGASAAGPCFPDADVGRAVDQALEEAGVHLHRDCLLARVETVAPRTVTSATFASDHGPPLHLRCGVFIALCCRGVDYDTFKSVNDASLVFDGRLVIDATFHTNDPAIRAAGPLTKFSRRYCAEQWSHDSFNSREVGQDLAVAMLALLDPTLEPPASAPHGPDHLIPEYNQAKVQGGRLPGGYHYLHVTRPSALPPGPETSHRQQGTDVRTGRVDTGNYFCVHLNGYEAVESITCLSLKLLPVSNLLCLYGKHQQLLNHLVSRFQQGLVHDLYSFFREGWCLALYHDRFPDFEQEIQQLFSSATLTDHDSASTDVPESPACPLREVLDASAGLSPLKSSALTYLRFNRKHLPVYALPGMP